MTASFSFYFQPRGGGLTVNFVTFANAAQNIISNVESIIELVMIRDNMLQLPSDVFSLMDIKDVISLSFLCTS